MSNDIVIRLRDVMPSSLNDALRTMEDAAQEIERLRAGLAATPPNAGCSNSLCVYYCGAALSAWESDTPAE
jgi:hypothetical protein